MSNLRTGVAAPDFELKDQSDSTVRLRDFRGKGPVVVYFYPKDDTSGCTAEACSFRDEYGRFRAAGATILGISSDDADSHQKFIAKYSLPFTLLSDPGGRVRKTYGALAFLGLMPGRSTIVIDRNGVVQHVFTSQLEFTKHCEEALRAIEGSKMISDDSKTIRVVARFKARPGCCTQLQAVLETLVEPTNREDGCLLYQLHANTDDQNDFVFIEEWTSAEALDAHSKSDHLREARMRFQDMIEGGPDVRTYFLIR